MGLFHQGGQLLLRAEGGIDGVVVDGVVFVTGVGTENGGHVDHIHAQLADIGKLFRDAPQIAAQGGLVGDGRLIPDPVLHRKIGGKSGGEDLVDHLVGSPGRHLEPLFFPQRLGAIEMPLVILRDGRGEAAVAEKYPAAVEALQLKAVAQAYHLEAKLRFVVIVQAVAGYLDHGGGFAGVLELQRQIFVTAVERDAAHIVLFGLQTEDESPGGDAEAPALGRFVTNGSTVHK